MPNIFYRKSLRLPHWDYASPGMYYVTIVTWQRIHHFGRVAHGRIILSDAGRIADTIWNMIPMQFPHVSVDEYVIMPNHIHGIIEIHPHDRRVGIYADHANTDADHANTDADHANTDADHANTDADHANTDADHANTDAGENAEHEHVMRRDGLEKIVKWFKGRVTFEFHAFMDDARRQGGMNAAPTYGESISLWQRNYYEHIVRNDDDVNRIRAYIKNNPSNWQNDALNNEP